MQETKERSKKGLTFSKLFPPFQEWEAHPFPDAPYRPETIVG
jgi:hypothetical protein